MTSSIGPKLVERQEYGELFEEMDLNENLSLYQSPFQPSVKKSTWKRGKKSNFTKLKK